MKVTSKTSKKLTQREKNIRRVKREIKEENYKLMVQGSIIGFHNVMAYEHDTDGSIAKREVEEAREKMRAIEIRIAELQQKLSQIQLFKEI